MVSATAAVVVAGAEVEEEEESSLGLGIYLSVPLPDQNEIIESEFTSAMLISVMSYKRKQA